MSISLQAMTDDELGQLWGNRFGWYLMEKVQGKALLDDEMHRRMCQEMHDLDDEIERRGLPVNRAFTEAFCTRSELPEEDMKRLVIQTYGRDVRGET